MSDIARKDTAPFDAWWMLVILMALYVLSIVDRTIITMLIEPIKKSLNLSDVQMSLIVGPAFAIFYGVFGFPLGWAADKFQRRHVIYGGVTLWSIAAASSGLATGFWSLLFARIGVGVGEASLTPAAYSLIGDKFPRNQMTLAMSVYQTAAKIGTAIAFGIGAAVIGFAAAHDDLVLPFIGAAEPWHLTLILTGAPGVFLALLVYTFREPKRLNLKPRQMGDPGVFLSYVKNEWILLALMAVGFGAVAICLYSLLSWTPTYITRVFQIKAQHYGPVLSLISLLGAGSMIIKGAIVDWLYARGVKDAHLRFYTWLLFIALPFTFLTYQVSNIYLFYICYGMLYVIALQFIVYVAATIQLIAPAEIRGRLTGAYLGLFTLMGLGIGPTMTAMVTDYFFKDEQMIGWSLTITAVASIIPALILLRVALVRVRELVNRTEEA